MDGWVKIGTELDTKSFDAQITEVEDKLDKLAQETEIMKKSDGFDWSEDIIKNEAEIERLTNKLSILKEKQSTLNNENFDTIEKSLKKVGNETENVIKKVGKWVLAIFGVRSAYSMIQKSMSTLSQYDEKMAANLEYIRLVIASSIQPLVEWLVQGAYKLLVYLGYILKAWFGIDIFANATANALNKTNKSAQELRKTLMGFDEMNVLNDSGTTGTAGGVLDKIDFPKPEDIEIPKWIQWIADHGKEIATIIGLIGAAWAGWKVGLFLSNITRILGGAGTAAAAGSGLMGILATLLLIAELAVIAITIVAVAKGFKEVQENIDSINQATKDIGNRTVENINKATEAYKNGQVKAKDYYEYITKMIEIIGNESKTNLDILKDSHFTWKQKAGMINETAIAQKPVYDTTKKLVEEEMISLETQRNIYKELENQKMEYQLIRDEFKKHGIDTKEVEKIINTISGTQSTIYKTIKDQNPELAKDLDKYKEISKNANRVKEDLQGANKELKDLNNTKIQDKEAKVTYSTTGLKGVLNQMLEGPRQLLKPLGIKIPYLATGGIINMPGRGVSVGGGRAIGGEAGAEGVIPLTDSQAMETLGEAIGKYVNLFIQNEVKMDNRTIQRTQERIRANKDFATNR